MEVNGHSNVIVTKYETLPDSKVHGANVGPTWGRQDPGGPHVGHMNLAIWVLLVMMEIWDKRFTEI